MLVELSDTELRAGDTSAELSVCVFRLGCTSPPGKSLENWQAKFCFYLQTLMSLFYVMSLHEALEGGQFV